MASRAIAPNWRITRACMNLLPYLRLNSPPRAMLNKPMARAPSTAASATPSRIEPAVDMGEIYGPRRVPASGNGAGGECYNAAMSYLDRIAECNAHDLGGFLPFRIGEAQPGWVKPAFARRLADFPDVFAVDEGGVRTAPALDGFEARTEAVESVLRALSDDGTIGRWRDEAYPVGGPLSGPHLMWMDRSAIPFFGVRAYGVHVNGFVRDGGRIRMWIGRRAADKATYPGMLDNFVAGGQPVGIGLMENVIKEAGEEAGVPEALAAAARPVGAVSYCHEIEEGLKPDVMYCYDLELPAAFVPENQDGEIEEFYLWPIERAMETVAETDEFKFNCNLVCIDFFVRHGLIGPESPDYLDIVRGLRR